MADHSRKLLVLVRQMRDDYETALHFKDGSESQKDYLEKARQGSDQCEDQLKQLYQLLQGK